MINIYNELIKDINKTIEECIFTKFYFNHIKRRIYIVEQYKYIIMFLNKVNLITYNEYRYLIEKLDYFLGYNK